MVSILPFLSHSYRDPLLDNVFVIFSAETHVNRYEFINDVILDHLDDEIKSTDRSGVWRYLISFKVTPSLISIYKEVSFPQNLLRAIENIGIVSVYGIRYLSTGNVTQQNFIKFVILKSNDDRKRSLFDQIC